MNHFLYKVFFSLIFLSTFCFAQNEPPIKQEVDSAAYYEQLYQYNLDKYNFDKKAANIALITAGVSVGLAMVSGFSISFYVFEQYSEDNKKSAFHVTPMGHHNIFIMRHRSDLGSCLWRI